MKIVKGLTGIYTGISSADYHSSTFHYSSSVLKDVLKDPHKIYKIMFEGAPRENKSSDALELGSLLHTMILEPELIYEEFAFFDGASRRGNAWEVFKLENEGKMLMSASQKRIADDLILAFNASKIINFAGKEVSAPQLFTGGIAEESCFTEINGVPIKVRPDYRISKNKKLIIDLKTTGQTPNFIEDARELTLAADYHLSAALYVRALKELTGDDYEFYWVYLSKQDKRVNVYKCGEEMLKKGLTKVDKAINIILDWQKNGYKQSCEIREI